MSDRHVTDTTPDGYPPNAPSEDVLAPLPELQALFERQEPSALRDATLDVLRRYNVLAALLVESETAMALKEAPITGEYRAVRIAMRAFIAEARRRLAAIREGAERE